MFLLHRLAKYLVAMTIIQCQKMADRGLFFRYNAAMKFSEPGTVVSQINLYRMNQLVASGQSERIFHGRGGAFQGGEFVTIDCFGSFIFIVLYCYKENQWIHQLMIKIQEQCHHNLVFLVQDRSGSQYTVRYVDPNLAEQLAINEGSLRFYLYPNMGQNLGHFLDTQSARQNVQQ